MDTISSNTGKGYIILPRGLSDLPFLKLKKGHEFSKKEALIYLLEHASYEEKLEYIDGLTIKIQRGQLVRSLRYLAEKWGWGKDRVSIFLRDLENVGWVIKTTDYAIIADSKKTKDQTRYNRRPTLITLLNYNEIQRSEDIPDPDQSDTFIKNYQTAIDHTPDKPKPNQINNSNYSITQKPRGSSLTINEAFPKVKQSKDFIDATNLEWHNYPLRECGWSVEKIIEELLKFWEYYDENQHGLHSLNTKRKNNWFAVWKIWCGKPFRNGKKR